MLIISITKSKEIYKFKQPKPIAHFSTVKIIYKGIAENF